MFYKSLARSGIFKQYKLLRTCQSAKSYVNTYSYALLSVMDAKQIEWRKHACKKCKM